MKKELINAQHWLDKRKWKKFLMSIPEGKAQAYLLGSANDLFTLRVRAAQLNNDSQCERQFSVVIDFDNKLATVTATKK